MAVLALIERISIPVGSSQPCNKTLSGVHVKHGQYSVPIYCLDNETDGRVYDYSLTRLTKILFSDRNSQSNGTLLCSKSTIGILHCSRVVLHAYCVYKQKSARIKCNKCALK